MLSLKRTIQPSAGRLRKLILKKIKNLLWQNRNKNWDADNDQWDNE